MSNKEHDFTLLQKVSMGIVIVAAVIAALAYFSRTSASVMPPAAGPGEQIVTLKVSGMT